MQKWEYKVIDGWPTEDKLNELGEEEWELVSVAVAAHSSEFAFPETIRAYLKRPFVDYDEDADTRSSTW